MGSGEIIALIANTGGTLGLAIFAIWRLNEVWKARLEEVKRDRESIKELWECTREALQENTKVIALWLERSREN